MILCQCMYFCRNAVRALLTLFLVVFYSGDSIFFVMNFTLQNLLFYISSLLFDFSLFKLLTHDAAPKNNL
jgi:hypothetical protein